MQEEAWTVSVSGKKGGLKYAVHWSHMPPKAQLYPNYAISLNIMTAWSTGVGTPALSYSVTVTQVAVQQNSCTWCSELSISIHRH